MINRMLRRLTVGRRLFVGFLFLVIIFALSIPIVIKDHQLLAGRLGKVTTIDKKADRMLLLGSKRIESSRVNLMRFLRDYLPSAQTSLNDIIQASQFLSEAEELITDQEQKSLVRQVTESLSNYRSNIRQIGVRRKQAEDFDINRLVFGALKDGNDIGSQIENIVEKNEVIVENQNRIADRQFQKNLRFLIVYYAVALALGFILFVLLDRSITIPVTELKDSTDAFRQGRADFALTVIGNDELSQLTNTFNQMAAELDQNRIELQERAEALEKELSERKRAEKELQRYQANLEELVDNRTQELNATLQNLKESERRQSDIIEFLPDPTFVIDNKGVIVAWNKAMENLTGVSRDNMLGKGNYEYALPFYNERRPMLVDMVSNWDETIKDKYLELKKDGDRLEMENFIPHMGEEGVYISGTARVLFDADGNEMGAIESIRDITERKKVEAELHRNLEELRRFNQFTLDREIRMIDLKKEINQLHEQLGEVKKYKIVS